MGNLPYRDAKACTDVEMVWHGSVCRSNKRKKRGPIHCNELLMCPACYEPFTREEKPIEACVQGHVYHSACIHEWIKHRGVRATCPECREPLLPRFADAIEQCVVSDAMGLVLKRHPGLTMPDLESIWNKGPKVFPDFVAQKIGDMEGVIHKLVSQYIAQDAHLEECRIEQHTESTIEECKKRMNEQLQCYYREKEKLAMLLAILISFYLTHWPTSKMFKHMSQHGCKEQHQLLNPRVSYLTAQEHTHKEFDALIHLLGDSQALRRLTQFVGVQN